MFRRSAFLKYAQSEVWEVPVFQLGHILLYVYVYRLVCLCVSNKQYQLSVCFACTCPADTRINLFCVSRPCICISNYYMRLSPGSSCEQVNLFPDRASCAFHRQAGSLSRYLQGKKNKQQHQCQLKSYCLHFALF